MMRGVAWMLPALFGVAPAPPWWGVAWVPALLFGEAPPVPRAVTPIIIPIIVVPIMPVTVAMPVTGECNRRKGHRG